MANDAFALSPISASASLPSESDYEAISEAFMETARGRWFLKEYARRNRNSDTTMVLEAVSRIEAAVAAQKREAEAAAAPRADASSRAVMDALTTAQDTIRTAVADARAAASEAMSAIDIDLMLAPSHKALRIIREVSWRLREVGYDGRICDILESQAEVIETGNDAVRSQNSYAAVQAAFDLIDQRIDQLAQPEPTTTVTARPQAPSAPADLAEVRLAREKGGSVDATMARATVPAAMPEVPATKSPASRSPDQIEPARPEPEPPLPENVVALAAPKALAPVEPPVGGEPIEDQNRTVALAADPVGATATADPLEFAPQLAASVSGHPDAPPRHEDTETGTTAAAIELTADAPSPDAAGALLTAVTDTAPAQAEALSLGSSLLARGMVAPPRTDPLAPLRRMSQAEKIAFFS